MTHQPEPAAEPSLRLTEDFCQHLWRTLQAALPAAGDTAEDRLRRDRAAVARMACLAPINADEAAIAAQYIAADAQAMDCLRLAQQHADDVAQVLKCTALAIRMFREARASRTLLERLQAPRSKPDSTAAASGKAAAAPPPDALPPAEPDAAIAAEADRYALEHRKRASLIRRYGRVPDRLNFGPLKPELIRRIATGDSPILRTLDLPEGKLAARG